MPPFAVLDTNLPSREGSPGQQSQVGDSDAEEENRLVRGLAAELLKLDSRKAKRKHSNDDDNGSNEDDDSTTLTKTWHQYGRDFVRLGGDPWMKLDGLIQRGILNEAYESDDEENADEPATEKKVQDGRILESWNNLCDMFPAFKETMIKFATNRYLRDTLARQVTQGVDSTRANDTSSLKKAAHGYLLLDTSAPVTPLSAQKDLRGFHHPVTARLLTPLQYPATNQTFTEILTGGKPVTASLLPRLLYPDDREFDQDDIDTGLLRGHYILRVIKHILINPASALLGPGVKKGRRGNASLMGMTSMSAYAIAYAVVQAHFAISSVSDWTQVVGTFDYKEFYWNIVEMCRGDEGMEIIKYFNQQVFGAEYPEAEPNEEEPPVPSSMDLLATQRAAKRRRLAEEQRITEERRQAAEEERQASEERRQADE